MYNLKLISYYCLMLNVKTYREWQAEFTHSFLKRRQKSLPLYRYP